MNKAYWIEYFQNVSNDFYNRNIVDILQEVEKDISDYLETVAQQPLSGSPEGSPKCLNKDCDYYNEKYDMNCDANENLYEKCLGTSDNGKRCRKFGYEKD